MKIYLKVGDQRYDLDLPEQGFEQGLVLGRDKQAGIQLKDRSVSRRHARIYVENGRIYVEDLRSANGVIVNGQRISAAQVLMPGDILTLGHENVAIGEEFAEQSTKTVMMKAPPIQPAPTPPPQRPPQPMVVTPPHSRSPPPVARIAPPVLPPQPAVAAPTPIRLRSPPATDAPSPPTIPPFIPAAKVEVPPEPKPYGKTDDPTPTELMDRVVNSVRKDRETRRLNRENSRNAIEEEWNLSLEFAGALKARFGQHPNIRYFAISPRFKEVQIRAIDNISSKERCWIISRRHPDGKQVEGDMIWLMEMGEEARQFKTADTLFFELARTLAHLVA